MDTACILAAGKPGVKGYVEVSIGGVRNMAHRVVYAVVYGAIPVGVEIDHMCKVRNCVNPLHLQAVTPPVNKSLAAERRDRCRNGHLWAETEYWTGKPPKRRRRCHTCDREQRARR